MSEMKKEPQDASPDPLEGKSVDELKKMVNDLVKTNEEQNKKLNQYRLMIITLIGQLKESGLDLQLIARNASQILEKPN